MSLRDYIIEEVNEIKEAYEKSSKETTLEDFSVWWVKRNAVKYAAERRKEYNVPK